MKPQDFTDFHKIKNEKPTTENTEKKKIMEPPMNTDEQRIAGTRNGVYL
ncbi:MAG: hypothetical protein ACETVX_03340 [bacterium]|nr:hypothetical protein [candidate division WOR-3 bacterium]